MNPFDAADVLYPRQGGAGGQGATTVAPGRAAAHGAPDAAVERILYRDNALPDVPLDHLQDAAMVPAEQRAEGSREFRQSLHALGVDSLGGRTIANRVAALYNQPLDQAGTFRLGEEAKLVLGREFGSDFQVEMQALTRALDKHPRLRDLLQATGAGNDPDVVRELLHGQRRARARG